jgi:hypothetical protein
MRPAQPRLLSPILLFRDASGDPKRGRSAAPRHQNFNSWIIAHDAYFTNLNPKPFGHKTQRV